ncbi:MAG: hypothetical protein R3F11_01810 [Verrucomicrobiales bacterium]
MGKNLKTLKEQVIGKMHWDASEQEIRDWLSEKHGIVGEDADLMIAAGLKAKAASVRKASLLRMTVAAAAAAAVPLLLLLLLSWLGDHTTGLLLGEILCPRSAGFGCLGYVGKNLIQVISGTSETAIDA